ncbi:MAG TPA: histidine phosphatase family protein [Rhodanobacteraceae bacterium]
MRHGDTGQRSYRGQLDDPLTAQGWMQSRAAVDQRDWDALVTSSLVRCAAFARELARKRTLPLRIDERLAEYYAGDWQGMPIDVIAREQGDALARYWADPVHQPPPHGEPFEAFRRRVCAALDEIAANRDSVSRVLVVTHGGVIRLLQCITTGRGFGAMANLSVPNATLYRLRWPPTSGGV